MSYASFDNSSPANLQKPAWSRVEESQTQTGEAGIYAEGLAVEEGVLAKFRSTIVSASCLHSTSKFCQKSTSTKGAGFILAGGAFWAITRSIWPRFENPFVK